MFAHDLIKAIDTLVLSEEDVKKLEEMLVAMNMEFERREWNSRVTTEDLNRSCGI